MNENKTENKTEDESPDAIHLENKHVHQVYDMIATHFSDTRFKPWPKVEQFLKSLPAGSLVLDVGCGNGKYFKCNTDIFMLGCDRSKQLLNICTQRQHQVFLTDCLQISVRPVFDAIICIAVLHHMASHERRLRALQLLTNMLSVKGKALVYVWAFEQYMNGKKSVYINSNQLTEAKSESCNNMCVHQNRTQFKQQDVLVPWKKKDEHHLRYYHVFKEKELETLIHQLTNARLCDVYYDEGNWCALIERTE